MQPDWILLCRLDIPKAPQLVAALHVRGIAAKAVPLQSLQQACEGIEDLTDRRDYAALVLQSLQASSCKLQAASLSMMQHHCC